MDSKLFNESVNNLHDKGKKRVVENDIRRSTTQDQYPEPEHVTLEPNEHNANHTALTAYFPQGTDISQAASWIKHADRHQYDVELWVNPKDIDFTVDQSENQPVPNLMRFQFFPTA